MKPSKNPHKGAQEAKKEAKESLGGIGQPSDESLGAELDEANRKLAEYTDLLQRLQADFENHVKRSESQRQSIIRGASRDLITKLLEVMDTMDAVLAVEAKTEGEARILDGFKRFASQFNSALQSEGLREIEASGVFKPDYQEAVETVECPGKSDGTIAEVVQKGYTLNDQVIRTSKVVVVKNKG